jgi:hypothetical protein
MADVTPADRSDMGLLTDPAAASSRRRGAPRGPRLRNRDALRLEGQTVKSYALNEQSQRTIAYLRLVVNQRQIPEDATVSIDAGRLTIEWSE